jgi:Metallo-peptidase family M12B Reprolysin-like
MSTSLRVQRISIALGFLLVAIACALPSPSHAVWVNGAQFQVGGKLTEIVPTLNSAAPGIANTPALVDPTCGSQGGTSLALVRGRKLAGVDPILYPTVLVVSCLDNGGSAAIRSRLNFVNPITTGVANANAGVVVKQISTTIGGVVAAPSNGWAHLVHRPDKGDLLGCGADGRIYSIDYSQTSTQTDGTATLLITPTTLTSCSGLAWDAENDTIYQGVNASGNQIGSVVRFKENALLPDPNFTTSLSCTGNGMALSGGVLLVSCAGQVNNRLVIQRINKTTGANLQGPSSISLPVLGSTTQGFLGLTAISGSGGDPGLGDLACDPVTFQKLGSSGSDQYLTNPPNSLTAGRDMYRDAVWSRRGVNGNGVAAVEFPAFTCGLPSTSVVGSFSPLAAGLSTGTPGSPGQSPLTSCFDNNGIVVDSDGDGLPNCWEANNGGSTGSGGIDFDGDGTTDLTLCAQVNINGDGSTFTPECAKPDHKDLFVEAAWMQNHKPDPQALSQSPSVTGVQSVREAFRVAPVGNPDGSPGINIHIRVDGAPVTFTNLSSISTSHACYVALTPCTGLAGIAPNPSLNSTCLGASDTAADYDDIKAANFDRFNPAADPATDANNLPRLTTNAANAKRLAFRHVLFAHQLVGNPQGGSTSSGCSEVGGDDAVVSLGSFTAINGHGQGTTDQQAGTFMHEFGHLLGLDHGGEDAVNNKPNYRSVMSYNRQFSGSPITNRRLDYSRSDVDLNKASLNECAGIGTLASDPTLGPIGSSFPSADQIAFGPGGWTVVTPATATGCASGQLPINWNRTSKGTIYQTSTADINSDGSTTTTLFGSNDWANLLYRLSAAVDFAGGRSETLTSKLSGSEMTKEDETDFFLKKDMDGNGIGDGRDCGGTITVDPNGVLPPTTAFPCTHRIDIKPSFSFPKTINPGTESTISIAIFSERNSSGGVWDATTQVVTQMLTSGCTDSTPPCLTFSVENVVEPVKTNKNGQGTCSAQNLADPITGQNDGVKDLKCQFATSGLPPGTHFGVVCGYFVDPLDVDPSTGVPATKGFCARQEVTILP